MDGWLDKLRQLAELLKASNDCHGDLAPLSTVLTANMQSRLKLKNTHTVL